MPANLYRQGFQLQKLQLEPPCFSHLRTSLKCSVHERQGKENSSTQIIHKGERKEDAHAHTQRKHSCSQSEFIFNIHENIHRTLQCYLPKFCCLE